MRCAHRVRRRVSGWQTNSFSRLAVRDRAVCPNGPDHVDAADHRGTRIRAREAEAAVRRELEIGSSVDARARSMNVTTTSCTPAVTCTGMLAKRCMISARAGAPPRSTSAKSSAAAELRAKHLVAIEQHHERVLGFERTRIEAHIEIRERDAGIRRPPGTCA